MNKRLKSKKQWIKRYREVKQFKKNAHLYRYCFSNDIYLLCPEQVYDLIRRLHEEKNDLQKTN
jgi:hypothetical protein